MAEREATVAAAMQWSVQENQNSVSLLNTPESATMQEPLVGSQKRKARKTKITHLVRTADGRVSPAEVLGKNVTDFFF